MSAPTVVPPAVPTVVTRWTWAFDEAPELDEDALKRLLGGKGASLARMTAAGLRVPPGFTIVTAACGRTIADGGRWPSGLEAELRAQVARLERACGRRFGIGPGPLLVSVRSGAAVSMPGMMDTLLNCGLSPALASSWGDEAAFWRVYRQFVLQFARSTAGIGHEAFADGDAAAPGAAGVEACIARYERIAGRRFPRTPWEALVACVDAVFGSWNSERAQAYRSHHGIQGLDGTAVTVQAMFPSEVSGVLFTQDPNDLAAGRIVVEAAYGLGESVVSGDAAPDRFLVAREDLRIVQATIGRKAAFTSALGEERGGDHAGACLDEEQVRELCRLALRVEAHAGVPVDLEWGLAEGGFALLQSRPIRGLDVLADVEAGRLEEIARLRALAGASGRKVWVAHNLGETLRAPTPLTWDLVSRFMRGVGGFGRLYRDLGYRPGAAVMADGFLELICGRIYADPDRLATLFHDALPMRYDLDAVRRDPRLLEGPPTRFDPERAQPGFLVALPGALAAMQRCRRRLRELRRDARRAFLEDALPPFRAWVATERGRDLSRLGTPALLEVLEARAARVLDDFAAASLKPGYAGGVAYAELETLLRALLGATGAQVARTLTSALEGDTTFEQDALLFRVAQGEARIDDFIERFGHRTTGEMELMEPRWREDRRYLESRIAQLRAHPERSPERLHHENRLRRAETERELPALLAAAGAASFRRDVERLLAEARALLPFRETGKHWLMTGYELLRLAVVELGRRWDLGRDVFFLRVDELARFEAERPALEAAIARRRLRWTSAQRLDPGRVVDSAELDRLGLSDARPGATDLVGDAVAGGIGSGPARIVLDPREAGDLGTGYVLVCPSTDPGWTPLFMNARGLVVERGGILSHGAIVARDFGIPAVVCRDATRLIAAGATVRVDGNVGRVVILDGKGG